MDADAVEIRVLGCLIEKQRTTPDTYPLTLNSLRLACNQATNRDPVVDYDEETIRDALQRLWRKEWARLASGQGSRSVKYRQLVQETLGLADDEVSVLCVLMLRGPQTPGELKQRTERLHPFPTLAEVEETLARLVDRELVARLEPPAGAEGGALRPAARRRGGRRRRRRESGHRRRRPASDPARGARCGARGRGRARFASALSSSGSDLAGVTGPRASCADALGPTSPTRSTTIKSAIEHRPTAAVKWHSRVRAVRPPPRPLRVLDPRRGVQDPGARRQGRTARDAGRLAHRSRLARRRDRPLQGGAQAGREADHRLRGLRRRRPPASRPRAPRT